MLAEGGKQKEGEEEGVLTVNNQWQKVGKHNALSGKGGGERLL